MHIHPHIMTLRNGVVIEKAFQRVVHVILEKERAKFGKRVGQT